MTKQPKQPTELINGVRRFKQNSIVRFLLERGPYDLNTLRLKDFNDEDWVQFSQLIGYSVCGWADLSYVTDEDIEEVESSILESE